MEALIRTLKANGHLPGNADLDYVSSCLSTRLDPVIFPYLPKVSFCLQYFKRPHMISSYVTRLMGGMQKYGIAAELIVNVDNIEDSREWLVYRMV